MLAPAADVPDVIPVPGNNHEGLLRLMRALRGLRVIVVDDGSRVPVRHAEIAVDVDLCWRLEDAGWRLRYEPVARVAHDHRVTLRKWFGRRPFYGTGATEPASRHHGKVPPVAMARSTLFALLLAASGTRAGMVGALITLITTVVSPRRLFVDLDHPTRPRTAVRRAPRVMQVRPWAAEQRCATQFFPVSVAPALHR